MINWGTSSGCIFNSLSLETSRPTAPRLPASPLHLLCQPTGEYYVLYDSELTLQALETLLEAQSW